MVGWKSSQILPSLSDKAKLFPEFFLETPILITYVTFTLLKLISNSTSNLKMDSKVINALGFSNAYGCIPVVVQRNCEFNFHTY